MDEFDMEALQAKAEATAEEYVKEKALDDIKNRLAKSRSILQDEDLAEKCICELFSNEEMLALVTAAETLLWYGEDDARSVDNGILESVSLRPAKKAIEGLEVLRESEHEPDPGEPPEPDIDDRDHYKEDED